MEYIGASLRGDDMGILTREVEDSGQDVGP